MTPTHINMETVRLVEELDTDVAKHYMEELEKARKVGKSRQFRGVQADSVVPVSARFGQIYSRASYQRRRGR